MPYKDRDTQLEAQKQWYYSNRDKQLESTRARKRALIEEINSLKESSPCSDCGKYYHYSAMQFDHISDNKVESISILLRTAGRDKVYAEIEKCELVCANCHAFRTWLRRKG